jgi:hypothetical protein
VLSILSSTARALTQSTISVLDAGGVLGQSHGVIDDGHEFATGAGVVDESGAGEVTSGGWRGIGSVVELEVGVVAGVGEGRFEFSEPGPIVGLMVADEGQDAMAW